PPRRPGRPGGTGSDREQRAMTVVLAGCGDLGTEVGLRFVSAGHEVVALRRSPQHLPAQFTGRALDLHSELPEFPDDTEILVIALTADDRSEQAYRATYLHGLHRLLDGLDRDGIHPNRVLMVSSTAVYGVSDGSTVDEDTPTTPNAVNGTVLLEAERALHERVPTATVLRLAGIYGPGRTSLIDRVRSGEVEIPDAPVHTNRIHRDDAAAAIVHLTTRGDAPAPIYLGVDDQPSPRGEVLRFLADELGVAPPPVGGAPPTRGGDKRCSNALLRATGFTLTYPTYREGYRAVLAGHGTRHR